MNNKEFVQLKYPGAACLKHMAFAILAKYTYYQIVAGSDMAIIGAGETEAKAWESAKEHIENERTT